LKDPTHCIELLPVSLLDDKRPLVNELKALAASLGLEFGWHYLLDLVWIIQQLGPVRGLRIIDAGAGTGILQWYLARHGAKVISIDRASRALLPVRFRRRFQVRGIRPNDLAPITQVFQTDIRALADSSSHRTLKSRLGALERDVTGLVKVRQGEYKKHLEDKGHPEDREHLLGEVWIYNHDLAWLPDLEENSVDVVVSVSALEHNTPDGLEQVIHELQRVLKPNRPLLATLTGAKDQDLWHGPSSGWCYTAQSLYRLFDLPPETANNYEKYDEFFLALRNCAELRDGLASFYFHSDNSGMPGGVWDPQYMPVGVYKVNQK
jgi:SAM-dependent methyltransferase